MNEEPRKSTGRRLVGAAVRLLLVLVIGTAIGAGAYFGLPLAYRGLAEPVRLNAERIRDLEADLTRTRADLAALAERSGERTAELEASGVETREQFDELQAGMQADLSDLERQLDRLGAQLEALDEELETQNERLTSALEQSAEPDPELLRELAVTRAMLHLMRARLWLIENNLGLAAEEVQAARAALDGIEGTELVTARLDQTLAELETTPLVAADDLEIAWRLLALGQPNSGPVTDN